MTARRRHVRAHLEGFACHLPAWHQAARVFLVVALGAMIGLQWALVQSVAWVGMATSYSRQMPFARAVAKTFDGSAPCVLCKWVAEKSADQQQPERVSRTTKLDLLCDVATLSLDAPPREVARRPDLPAPSSHSDAPPLPPPRVA